MKKTLFILYCLPILFIGCNSQDTYIDPIKYNDALVDQQGMVIQKMTEILSQENTVQMKSLLPDFQKVIDTSLSMIKKITFFQDDYGLKQSFTEQMIFYKKNVIPYMNRLIDVLDELEEIESDDEKFNTLWNQYLTLVEEGSEMEKIYDEAVEKAQNKFSEAHGLGLEINPYEEELDNVVESLNDENWNEMIDGCVDGNEENREFCECLISHIKKDYSFESLISLSTNDIGNIGREYSVYCE